MSAEIPHNEPPESLLEESTEELYETAPCGYLTTLLDGRIVRANGTVLDWLGYKRHDLLGASLTNLLTVGGKMFFETHLHLLLRVQTAVDEIALDLVCKNGRILPALINARQKRNAAGQPLANRFTVFNASERRMYERQLLGARDLYRTTLSSIGDGVVATDTEGRITFVNPVAEQLSGWQEDDARGKPVDEVLVIVREDNREKVENPVRYALRAGKIVGLQNHTTLLSKDGREVPIDDSASPVRDGSGNVVGAVLVFRDISERRSVEKALRAAHEDLERSAAELRRSNDDLSQFAHVASHDLRSPLNTVIQFSRLLERDYANQLGDGRQLLDYLNSAAQRMARLIEDLLLYAAVSADTSLNVMPADANVQIETAVQNLRSSINESDAAVTHDVLPAVPIAATRLVQVFQNLIGNAIHYRRSQPPRIHISAVNQGDRWCFSCQDNGIGIAMEYRDQIFEPFKRLHGIDRPGSGIGLAVCKRIIERCQGRIWVESVLDQGSTFFFTLPKLGSYQ